MVLPENLIVDSELEVQARKISFETSYTLALAVDLSSEFQEEGDSEGITRF